MTEAQSNIQPMTADDLTKLAFHVRKRASAWRWTWGASLGMNVLCWGLFALSPEKGELLGYAICALLVAGVLLFVVRRQGMALGRDLEHRQKERLVGLVEDKSRIQFQHSTRYELVIGAQKISVDLSSYTKAEMGRELIIERAHYSGIVLSCEPREEALASG